MCAAGVKSALGALAIGRCWSVNKRCCYDAEPACRHDGPLLSPPNQEWCGVFDELFRKRSMHFIDAIVVAQAALLKLWDFACQQMSYD
jgi:hypothetical protein